MSEYGPWSLIVGGSEGVGSAFARLLAANGVSSVLVARKVAPLEETAEQVRALGMQARTVAADLTDPSSLGQILEQTGDLDLGLIVINAGANSYGSPFLDGELSGFTGVIDLNVTAPLALLHALGPQLRERGRGGIVVVGSMAGYVGQSTIGTYAAVKAFQRVFTEGLWLELKPYGIDVLHLVLGVTRTPSMERAGMNLDVPGLVAADPDDVAREGLANLKNGPVHVVGENAKAAERLSRFPRDQVVAGHDAMLRKLFG